ncbi:peptidase M48 [Kordiimonas sediminis]|uniref:Peptidase M48 n=2 Tax=Kordiimonas sediminis TaxID=1735581 RepID=A0A919AWW4_9PROT|nr:peptidase M48 [Kordiimonas sediminis]
MAADDVGELRGVLAHEAGHIAGRHYSRTRDAYQTAGMTSIVSMVLGAAAVLAGGGDAGMGLIMAGQGMAQGQVLAYSRAQESTTDQAGASYLDDIGVSGKGMISFFEKLRSQEILAQVRQDPYMRSHPLNSTRIMNLRDILEKSEHWDKPVEPDLNEKFLRLKAKLAGYLQPPSRTLKQYPLTDTSISARYARVYAYHKALEWDLALAEADALIALEPDNAYFYEIKGQILFENGRVEEALPVLEKAVQTAPQEPLIMTALGQALVSQENLDWMARAVPILEDAVRLDRSNSFAWFNLARAYSWLEQDGDAALATAERFYSVGAAHLALGHARKAMQEFKEGTPKWLRAQDILFVSEEAAAKILKQQRRQRRAAVVH